MDGRGKKLILSRLVPGLCHNDRERERERDTQPGETLSSERDTEERVTKRARNRASRAKNKVKPELTKVHRAEGWVVMMQPRTAVRTVKRSHMQSHTISVANGLQQGMTARQSTITISIDVEWPRSSWGRRKLEFL
jgi:hypothetical protein